jgi:tetratricopeptide (TPR) repeat protein
MGIAIAQALAAARIIQLASGQTLALTGAGTLVAAAAVMLKVRNDRRQRCLEEVGALALPPLALGRDPFPAVAEVSAYDVGVSLSKYVKAERSKPPYVPRDLDAAVVTALHERAFVVVVGASKAGKSRTAFEAMRRVHPGRGLVVPKAELGALVRLFGEDALLRRTRRPLLLWLDDLDRYLGPGGLDLGLLDKLEQARVITVGTITSRRRAELFDAADDKGRALETVLTRAVELHLEAIPTTAELRAAEELYPAEDFTKGIGEQLVAGHVLLRRYLDGVERSPAGRALVDAAVDWQRAGVARPITRAELHRLAREYLAQLRSNLDLDEVTFTHGLAWACEPIASHVALLTMTGTGGEASVVAFDYLVEQIDLGRVVGRREVPDPTWRFVLEEAGLDQLGAVGKVAYARRRWDIAEAAWRRAAGAELAMVAAPAMINLGQLLREQGDTEAAKRVFRKAATIDARPYQQAQANWILGGLLEKESDLDGAKAAYEQAAGSQFTTAAPVFLASLAGLLVKLGDTEGGKAIYQNAVDSADGALRLKVMNEFGSVLREHGDINEATPIYRAVLDSGDPNEAPWAMIGLGELHKHQGDTETAEYWFRRAVESGEIDAAPAAISLLGDLFDQRGDKGGAETAYEEASRCSHPIFAGNGLVNLGLLREERGDIAGAEAAYRGAIAQDLPTYQIDGLKSLAKLLIKQGDWEGAKAAHMELIEARAGTTAASAALELGRLLAKRGDIEGARTAYARAIATGHATVAPQAMNALGVLLHLRDPAAARAAYECAVASEHATIAPTAATNLGLLLETQGQPAAAAAAYERALATNARGNDRKKAERQLRRLQAKPDDR